MAELADRTQLEADLQRDLSRLSNKHRLELQRLMGDPPDMNNVPDSFWLDIERERRDEQENWLFLLFLLIAQRNGVTTPDAYARSFAQRRAAELARGYTQNTIRQMVTVDREIKSGQLTTSDVRNRLKELFSPSRDETIAVTEVSNANNATRKLAIDSKGGDGAALIGSTEVQLVFWITRCDSGVCDRCWPLHRIPMLIHRKWPLLHPRCRCYPENDLDAVRYESDDCPPPKYNAAKARAQRQVYLAARGTLLKSMGVSI